MATTETRITVRLGAAQLAALDDLADAHGGSRSQAVRALIGSGSATARATLAPDDLTALLEERARAGSVSAIRELQRLHADRALDEKVARLNAVARGDYDDETKLED